MKIADYTPGSIVKHRDVSGIHRVSTVTKTMAKIGDIDQWYNKDWLIPIPLTPDIFRKIPFLKEVKDGKETYWEGPVTDKIDMRSGNHFGHLDVVFETHDCDAIKTVQYLHDLQNAYYFFTGKEMEIEL